MKSARFVPAARREFLAEIVYYNQEQARLGARFTAAVEEAAARTLAFPRTGSLAAANTRRVFLQGFPFSVVYREVPDSGPLTNHSSRRSAACGRNARLSSNIEAVEKALFRGADDTLRPIRPKSVIATAV